MVTFRPNYHSKFTRITQIREDEPYNTQRLELQVLSSIAQVPVIVEFNPDNHRYREQIPQGEYDPIRGTEVYTRSICTVVNDTQDTLRNVSWALERVVWLKCWPDDQELNPENIHKKLHYDLPTFPTGTDIAPEGKERLWLFSRMRKSSGEVEPLRIIKGSCAFPDNGRLVRAYLAVTANDYAKKWFTVDLWVRDGILKMTHIRPE